MFGLECIISQDLVGPPSAANSPSQSSGAQRGFMGAQAKTYNKVRKQFEEYALRVVQDNLRQYIATWRARAIAKG